MNELRNTSTNVPQSVRASSLPLKLKRIVVRWLYYIFIQNRC